MTRFLRVLFDTALALCGGVGVALLILGCVTTPIGDSTRLAAMIEDCDGPQTGTVAQPTSSGPEDVALAAEVYLAAGGVGFAKPLVIPPDRVRAAQLVSELLASGRVNPFDPSRRFDRPRADRVVACLRTRYALPIQWAPQSR